MNSATIRIKNESGHPLIKSTAGAIGFDLHACFDSPYRDVPAHGRFKFDTRISIELPVGLGALVQPRSGLGLHHGIIAITGVIDQDYRGSVQVVLLNTWSETYRVLPGDRIAQLVIVSVPDLILMEVDSLDDTTRGAGGFGSTGR